MAIPDITPGEITADTLQRLIARRDPVILDIGCNDGGHTLWFLKLFRGSRVYSFEPDPRPRKRFRENVRSPRAVLLEFALAAEDGETEFYVSSGQHPDPRYDGVFVKDWDYSGSIRKPKLHVQTYPWVKFEGTIRVPTRRLDTWAKAENLASVDLIWADVQGAEVDLIAGGRETLRSTRFFYTEYSNRELYEGEITLEGILERLPDFEIVYRYQEDVLLKNTGLV